jgi:drug/metabolite transporter (DMT)-like permease
MAALLALAAALGWGSSDYASGIASRRNSAVSVVVLTHLTAVVALVLFSVSSLDPATIGIRPLWEHAGLSATVTGFGLDLPAIGFAGAPAVRDLLWGLAAGLGGGLGAFMLYRGLARGAMAVVAPITAAGAAAVPAVFGLATGDPVTVLGVVGIGGALVSIFLVSTSGEAAEALGRATTQTAANAAVEPTVVTPALGGTGRHHHSARTAIGPFVVSCVAAAVALVGGGGLSPTAMRVLGVALCVVALATTLMVAIPTASSATGDDGQAGRGLAARMPAAPAGSPTVGALAARVRVLLRIPGLPEALLSGVGFGSFFILLAQPGEDAGSWPLVSARGISVAVFTVAALATRGQLIPGRGSRWPVVLSGLLDAFAAVMFVAAIRSGHLSVVTVLSSMYPVFTVGLARVLSHERCSRLQVVGLGLAGASVGLLALS